MGRFLIHIDAQDAQDFFRRRLACVPDKSTRSSPESASPAAASGPDYPVHPVHRCSIYSPSRWICPVAGGGRPARRQTGVFPKGTGSAFREVARRIPSTSPSGRHPRERGRPARMLSLRLPLSFPAMLQPTALPAGTACGPAEAEAGRRSRLIPSGGDGRSCARLCAGGTPALPASLHPMTSSHQGHKMAEALWCCLSLKEVISLVPIRVHWWFVFIRVFPLSDAHSWFVFIRGSIGRFSSNDPPGRAGARLTRIGAPTMERVRTAGWAWLIRGASGR